MEINYPIGSASVVTVRHQVTTTSCMLNTARTVSGAASAYRNCAHGSPYVRFGSTMHKPYGRRSRSIVHGLSSPTDSITSSSFELMYRSPSVVANCVPDDLLLNGRRD